MSGNNIVMGQGMLDVAVPSDDEDSGLEELNDDLPGFTEKACIDMTYLTESGEDYQAMSDDVPAVKNEEDSDEEVPVAVKNRGRKYIKRRVSSEPSLTSAENSTEEGHGLSRNARRKRTKHRDEPSESPSSNHSTPEPPSTPPSIPPSSPSNHPSSGDGSDDSDDDPGFSENSEEFDERQENEEDEETQIRKKSQLLAWITRNVDLYSIRGTAIVNPSAINEALATSTSILNRDSLKLASLVQAVRLKLARMGYGDADVRWPECVSLLRRKAEIAQIRTMIDQGSSGEVHEDGEGCCMCYEGKAQIGGYVVECISDPVARDGCFACHARKKAYSCCHRMKRGNQYFVRSLLAAVVSERSVMITRHTQILIVIRLIAKVRNYIRQLSHPPQTPIDVVLSRLVDIVFDEEGMEETEEALMLAREELGAMNQTKETDAPGPGPWRKLDRGQQLSWSGRQVIEDEIVSWKASKVAVRKTCAVVAELSDALEAGGNAPHPIAKVIDDMINKFVLSSTLRKAGRQASEAREALGKPICYI